MKNISKLQRGSFILLMLLLLTGITSSNVFAKAGDVSIEGFAGIGIGPDDPDFDFGSTFGGGIGFGYEISDNFQLRTDVAYYKWDDTITDPFLGNVKLTLRNIPVFLGGRYYAPLNEKVRIFGELGLGVNFYEAEFKILGTSISESETKLGVIPGIGIEVMMTPRLGLGASARYHAISKGVGDFDDGETSHVSTVVLINYHL